VRRTKLLNLNASTHNLCGWLKFINIFFPPTTPSVLKIVFQKLNRSLHRKGVKALIHNVMNCVKVQRLDQLEN